MPQRPVDPSILETKKALIAEAAQRKQAALSPEDAALAAAMTKRMAGVGEAPEINDQMFDSFMDDNARRQREAAEGLMPDGRDAGISSHF